jgi:hypothetical protein
MNLAEGLLQRFPISPWILIYDGHIELQLSRYSQVSHTHHIDSGSHAPFKEMRVYPL